MNDDASWPPSGTEPHSILHLPSGLHESSLISVPPDCSSSNVFERSVPMLAMDSGMVEENGSSDPLAHSPGEVNPSVVTVTSVQSVIQPNQQSVIQTPANIQPVQISKGNVILVGKANSVIQSGPGSLQTLQVQETIHVTGATPQLPQETIQVTGATPQLPQETIQVTGATPQLPQETIYVTGATPQRKYRRILPKPHVEEDICPAFPPSLYPPPSPTWRHKWRHDILRRLLYDNMESLGVEMEEPPTFPPGVVDAGSDDSLSNDDESTKKRRDILTRRPSYRKILNDLGGGEIAANRGETTSDEEDSELSSHSIPTHYQTVIPAGAIQISSQTGDGQGLHTLTMTNATTAGGTIVQYTQGQDGQFFVPGEYVVTQGGGISGSPIIAEDQQRKREMRLLKNREAARECRRKKKEYIKCLENRVAVLENQNKALIDELKTLKELYCQQKTE